MPYAARADFQPTRVAVLDFDLKGEGYETEDMGAIVAEWFVTALVREGRFEIVERGLLKKIMAEHKLGASGLVDDNTATRIGKLLGVKVIISGSVLKLANVLEINARIIDVETASIIAAENVKSTAAAALQDLVVQMAAKIINNFPLEGYIVRRISGDKTVTVDLGKITGIKKSMQFVVYKEGEVIKHPVTGQVLDIHRIETGTIVITNIRDKISRGEIIEEKTPGAIMIGQRVQSRATLIPIPTPVTYDPQKPKPGRLPETAHDIIQLLRSSTPAEKIKGAKHAVRLSPIHDDILQVAEDELLKGYEVRTRDRQLIDALSWLCNVLGRSGQRKYKDTLYEVSKNARTKKLRGYAKKNYNLLK
jgi:TolB-like protein